MANKVGRPATEYRNEVKARITDAVYAVVQFVMVQRGCSESRAIAYLLERGAFGLVGTLPPQLADCSHPEALCGPAIR